MNMAPRPVDEVLAEYKADGFVVIEPSPTVITLERTNSWRSFFVGLLLTPL